MSEIRIIIPPNGIETTGLEPTENHRFKIIGTDNKNTVNSYAIASTPALISTNYGVLYRQDVKTKRAAYNHWDIEVPYARNKQVTGEWTWDFDTTGGSIHLTQAKEEVGRYPEDEAPNQNGAIAIDGDEVKGTDIIVPAMKINVNYRYALGYITLAQAKFLATITGTVNSDTFLTFAPGEVLFLGARGADGTEAEATINYQFAMAKNVEDQTIGEIAGVAKKAWDVAWVRYEDEVVSAGGKDQPTRQAKFVYVDRVYEEIAMSTALGFGGE